MKNPKMLIIGAFIILIISITAASAATEVFSGNVFSGENVKVDDRVTFRVTLNKERTKLFVDGGNMYASVNLGACEEMREGIFKFCYNETDFDEDELKYYAKIKVFQKKPSVTISRTITDNEFYVGTEETITTIITASGDDAQNVTFIDNMPDAIEITETDGNCYEYENSIYAKYNNINAGTTKTCTYKIKGKRELHQSTQAKVVYPDGFELKEVFSGTLMLDILPVIELKTGQIVEEYTSTTYKPKNETIPVMLYKDTVDFEDEEENPGVFIGQQVRFAVNVSNKLDDDIKITGINIYIPSTIKYISTTTMRVESVNSTGSKNTEVAQSDAITRIDAGLLRWTGTMSTNKSKQFLLKFDTVKSGFQGIVVKVDYTYDKENYTEIRTEAFSVSDPGLKFSISIIPRLSELESGTFSLIDDEDTLEVESLSPQRVKLYVNNLNPYSTLKNIRVYSDKRLFMLKPYTIANLGLSETAMTHDVNVVIPKVNISTDFEINVTATYENQFGEEHTNSTEFKISVKQFEDLIITHDSSEGNVLDGGEWTDFKVSVDNPRISNIRNVEVHDEISPGLSISGTTKKTLKLNKEEETEVYTYRITPPRVREKTYYNITTYLIYFDPDGAFVYKTNYTSTFTIYPKQPELTVTKTLSKDEVNVGEIIDIDYEVKNDEEKDEIKDIILNFPLQDSIDTIGERRHMIQRLGPGESITLENVEKIRPKLANESLKINMTVVEYSDAYGNSFSENSTEETIKSTASEIVGSAIFIDKKVTPQLNKSQETIVKIEVKNIGTESAQVHVEDNDRVWTIDVPGKSARTLDYPISFDYEGVYELPAPIASYESQGLKMSTQGSPRTVTVSQYVPTLVEQPQAEKQTQQAEQQQTEETEAKTFEEFVEEEQQAGGFVFKRQYLLIGILALLIIALVVAYIFYQRGQTKGEAKKPTFLE
jgi:hypothetical protein